MCRSHGKDILLRTTFFKEHQPNFKLSKVIRFFLKVRFLSLGIKKNVFQLVFGDLVCMGW